DSNDNVILIGGFLEVIELCELCGKHIFGIIDNQLKSQYFGYKIFGNDAMAVELYKEIGEIPLIITPDVPKVRKKLVEYYSEIGFKFAKLIHPGAYISKSARIGEGVVIQNFVNISSNVIIENFVKINTFVNIMHDSYIGKYSTIAPNSVILGRVKVNDYCYIGANSTILPEKRIGKNSTVGAGSVVTKDVGENETVVGKPSRLIEKK
ncbi:MAG: acetyltransferase, partial [Candidatus Thorarchaeota archaeon]